MASLEFSSINYALNIALVFVARRHSLANGNVDNGIALTLLTLCEGQAAALAQLEYWCRFSPLLLLCFTSRKHSLNISYQAVWRNDGALVQRIEWHYALENDIDIASKSMPVDAQNRTLHCIFHQMLKGPSQKGQACNT